MLGEIEPQELLFHFDPTAGHGAAAFERFAGRQASLALRRWRSRCHAQPLLDEPSLITAQIRDAGFKPDAIIISPSVDRQSTPPGGKWPECLLEEVYAAARTPFTDIRVGGVARKLFHRAQSPGAFLPRRFRPSATSPIVHAADDLSVMQTLEACPSSRDRSAPSMATSPIASGHRPFPAAKSLYGSPNHGQSKGARMPILATPTAPQLGFFAEAFAMAYIAKVLDAELECLTLSALTGSFGLLAGKDEPFAADGRRPLFNAVKTLAGLAGAEWRNASPPTPRTFWRSRRRPAGCSGSSISPLTIRRSISAR